METQSQSPRTCFKAQPRFSTGQLNGDSSPVKNLQNNSQLIINPEGSNLTEAAEEGSKGGFMT